MSPPDSFAYLESKVVSRPGVMLVVRALWYSPSATEPEVPEPVSGLVVVMPVMVPPPVPVTGNVCPGADVSSPFAEMEKPVAAGVAPPALYSRERLAEGVDVSLPVANACHAKFCATAAELLLDQALAPNSRKGEFIAADAVA